MKSFIKYLGILFVLQIIVHGCKKDVKGSTDRQTINVTVHENGVYKYDLGVFGDEEGALISKQAQHYKISEIQRIINSGAVIYHYTPGSNYEGADEVELKSARGSDGASENNKLIFTTIRFTIAK